MKKNFTILLFGLIAFFLLLSLGFWQISRKFQKEEFINSIKTNLSQDAIFIDSLESVKKYSKIKLKGKFLQNINLHLYGKRGKDGYYLLTPFQTDKGEIIIVACGWFNAINKQKVSEIHGYSEEEIVGITMPGEKSHFYMPKNDTINNVWINLNLDEMSKLLNINLVPFYLIQTNITYESELIHPIPVQNLTKVRNDHLEYAITWFCLAIALLIILFYKISNKNQ